MSKTLLSLRTASLALLTFTLGAQAQTWVQKADYPGPGRYWGAATGNSTKGYAGTGILSFEQFTSQQQDVYEYDPATDTWTALPNYPGGVREGMVAFTIGERIFFGLGTPFIAASTLLYEYVSALGEWQPRASAPVGSSHQKGFVIGDDFYIGPLTFEGQMIRYNATTDSWTDVAAFPGIYRNGYMAISVDGKGYIGGGNSSQGTTEQWYAYDPATDSWSESGALSPNSDQSCGTTINGVGYVYNVGGNGSAVYSYDPDADTWNFESSYGDIRTANGSFFTIGNKGYHVFGQQQQGSENVSMAHLWEFTPGSAASVAERSVAPVQVYTAADGSTMLVGTTPVAAATTLEVLDVDGRLLHSRTVPAGSPLHARLTTDEVGTGLRIAVLHGTTQWAGRVVVGR